MNEDFIKDTETTIEYAIVAVIALGVILTILIYKFRKLANLIIYFEFVYLVLSCFKPYYFGHAIHRMAVYELFKIFTLYSCKMRSNIIAVALVSMFLHLWLFPYIYTYDSSSIFRLILYCLSVVAQCIMLSLCVTYVA